MHSREEKSLPEHPSKSPGGECAQGHVDVTHMPREKDMRRPEVPPVLGKSVQLWTQPPCPARRRPHVTFRPGASDPAAGSAASRVGQAAGKRAGRGAGRGSGLSVQLRGRLPKVFTGPRDHGPGNRLSDVTCVLEHGRVSVSESVGTPHEKGSVVGAGRPEPAPAADLAPRGARAAGRRLPRGEGRRVPEGEGWGCFVIFTWRGPG